jgi:hypothetical protein
MVILTEDDKFNIAHMAPEATKYCAYPETMTPKEAEKWMDDVENHLDEQERL